MKRVLIIMLIALAAISTAVAEQGWILCQPDSFVYIRQSPGKGREPAGYLMLGDKVVTGAHRNGYTYVTGLSTESGDGWVASGYIVTDQPQIETVRAWIDSQGRVACRRAIGGDRRKWLRDGDQITLYASSAQWSITSEGFIQTEYILAER